MSKTLKIRSVKFNAAMNIILTASNTLIALITLPYVTRVLDVEGYGAVGFAQSTGAWFSTFCLLGIPVYGIRECARVRDDPILLSKTVKELLILLTIYTIIVLSIFATCIIAIPRFQVNATLLWIFFVNTLITSYGLEWFYQALEQYTYITIRGTLFKFLTLILVFVMVKRPRDFIIYGLILALTTCGNNIFNILHFHTLVSLQIHSPLSLRRHIRPIFSFGLVSIASSVYLWMDTVILGFLTNGNYQVGLYQLATKLKGFLAMVINAATNAAIPRLSYYLAHDQRESYERLLSKSITVITGVGLFIVGCLLVFPDEIITIISSQKYIQSTASLQIISISMFFSAFSCLLGFQILTPTGQESKLALANAIGVPISLATNFALDSHFGATGAAVASSLTEIAVFIVQFHYSKKIFNNAIQIKDFLKIVFSAILAIFCSVSFRFLKLNLSVIVAFLCGFMLYLIVWILSLLLMKEQFIMTLGSEVFRKLHH